MLGRWFFCMGKYKHFCQWLHYLRLNSWKVSLLNWDPCFFVCHRLLLNALADALPHSIPGSHGICFPALRRRIAEEATFSTPGSHWDCIATLCGNRRLWLKEECSVEPLLTSHLHRCGKKSVCGWQICLGTDKSAGVHTGNSVCLRISTNSRILVKNDY